MTTSQTQAFETVLRHHQAMSERLAVAVADVTQALQGEGAYQERVDALVSYLRSEVLPHALAEEATLYAEARKRSDLEDVVDEMIEEHRVLTSSVDLLAHAPSAPSALVHATRIGTLFSAHVKRENEGLLPILHADPNVDFDTLVSAMQRLCSVTPVNELDSPSTPSATSDIEATLLVELLKCAKELKALGKHDAACRSVAAAWVALRATRPDLAAKATANLHALVRHVEAEPVRLREKQETESPYRELDVRHLAPAQRHTQIFEEYNALFPGAGYVLVNDHDPRPLYYQFEAEHKGAYTWDVLEAGPTVWRVAISRPLAPTTQDAPTSSELDVRVIPHAHRHDVIFAAFDRLLVGESFVLVNDHDPQPLRYQFDARHHDQYDWQYEEAGPERWRVRLSRRR